MSDIDFSALTHQIVTTAGIMHHQTKLDVFIIRAYKLLSSGSIINSNALQSVTGSPQTTSTTPAATTTNVLSNGNGSNSMVSQNGSNSSIVNNTNGNSAGNNTNNLIQFQYSQLFIKISKLYNATISSGAIDDRSTSPKSAIELYQRFQQIIKELELSYEVSPYSRYFHRLDQGLWQIREDAELKSDRLWELVSLSIFSIYDPRTGQMINQGRRKAGSLTASTKGSPTEMMNNTNNNNSNNINTNKIQRASHSAGTGTINSTINNMMMDESLPQQLQRRLQTIPQDINSRSLNGYYTQPTSPGQGAFSFGLDNDATLYNTNNNANNNNNNSNNSNNNNNTGTSWKRRSLGSLGVDALDDDAVEELLQLTNTTKRQRTATPINYNNVNGGNVGATNSGMTAVMDSAEGTTSTHSMTSHTGNNSNSNSTGNNNSNNNNSNINNINNNNNSSGNSDNNNNHNSNAMDRYSNSAANNNNINIDHNLTTNDNMNNALISGETLVRQLKGTYETLVSEKNQRINQLERELELQRQETQWLRKMLIEDMGCVRSLLKDLRR